MTQIEPSIRIDDRFVLLREIIARYRDRLQQMEREVVRLFADNQLSAISTCIREKQQIERRVQRLEAFVARWESLAEMSID